MTIHVAGVVEGQGLTMLTNDGAQNPAMIAALETNGKVVQNSLSTQCPIIVAAT